ncbi:MAG: phage holin family protein [Chitinophagaceae bacterium]|nr:phage holin family protein [Chitinophagaceae bacterium]MCW5904187.1 phage holin family protein [Chitinophagaceae bacterium]
MMQQYITKTLVTSSAAIIASFLLSGVHIDTATTAILVAVVLGLLNTFVKPILIILTIPITIFTLGLFLLIINILIVKWVATLVPGFSVDNWWAALWFSIIVSIISALVQNITNHKQEDTEE